MDVAATLKVITSSNTIGRAVVIQLGNRDWVTIIEGINASDWSILPFVILLGKLYQASQYRDLPIDWVIALSNNGWTTNKLSVKWIKHFNRYIELRIKGVYRLLILNGHSSHATPKFNQFYIENKIITLCILPYTLYLLQPLNIGCFSPLKIAYGYKVRELIR